MKHAGCLHVTMFPGAPYISHGLPRVWKLTCLLQTDSIVFVLNANYLFTSCMYISTLFFFLNVFPDWILLAGLF